jgi:hypothetical protein
MALISRPWIEPGPTKFIAGAAEIVVDHSRVSLQIELVDSAGSMCVICPGGGGGGAVGSGVRSYTMPGCCPMAVATAPHLSNEWEPTMP